MITGVTAVIPSGDGAPMRAAFSTTSTASAAKDAAAAPPAPAAIVKPESSSAGSSTQNRQDDPGAQAATGAYLARLLAATITGRGAPEGRPARITPERLSTLISYLESSVSSTSPKASEEEHAVDVKS